MTKLNIAALAGIASAPPPPEPKVEGAVATDTTVTWPDVYDAQSYVVRWRRTDSAEWQESLQVHDRGTPNDIVTFDVSSPPGQPNPQASVTHSVKLPHIRVDDWVFGVSSVSKDGFESPVASAVPGGAFHPYIAPEKK